MKKIFFPMLFAVLVLAGCAKQSIGRMISYDTTFHPAGEVYITGEIDTQFSLYPKIMGDSEGSLFLSPDKEKLCYLSVPHETINCVKSGDISSGENIEYALLGDPAETLSGYKQILKKSYTNFSGLSFVAPEGSSDIFIYYEEPLTRPDLWKMDWFLVDLSGDKIYKINGGETSEPGLIKLMSVQGHYLLEQDRDRGQSRPSVEIFDYSGEEGGIASVQGSGVIVDGVAKIIKYNPYLPKCSSFADTLDGGVAEIKKYNPEFECDENNDTMMRWSEKEKCMTFTGGIYDCQP